MVWEDQMIVEIERAQIRYFSHYTGKKMSDSALLQIADILKAEYHRVKAECKVD